MHSIATDNVTVSYDMKNPEMNAYHTLNHVKKRMAWGLGVMPIIATVVLDINGVMTKHTA